MSKTGEVGTEPERHRNQKNSRGKVKPTHLDMNQKKKSHPPQEGWGFAEKTMKTNRNAGGFFLE